MSQADTSITTANHPAQGDDANQAKHQPLHLENLRRDLAMMRSVVVAAVAGQPNEDALRGVAFGLEVWEGIAGDRVAALKAAAPAAAEG